MGSPHPAWIYIFGAPYWWVVHIYISDDRGPGGPLPNADGPAPVNWRVFHHVRPSASAAAACRGSDTLRRPPLGPMPPARPRPAMPSCPVPPAPHLPPANWRASPPGAPARPRRPRRAGWPAQGQSPAGEPACPRGGGAGGAPGTGGGTRVTAGTGPWPDPYRHALRVTPAAHYPPARPLPRRRTSQPDPAGPVCLSYTLRPSLGGCHPCNRSVPKTQLEYGSLTMGLVWSRSVHDILPIVSGPVFMRKTRRGRDLRNFGPPFGAANWPVSRPGVPWAPLAFAQLSFCSTFMINISLGRRFQNFCMVKILHRSVTPAPTGRRGRASTACVASHGASTVFS